jgi:hypothetical protein
VNSPTEIVPMALQCRRVSSVAEPYLFNTVPVPTFNDPVPVPPREKSYVIVRNTSYMTRCHNAGLEEHCHQ